MEDMELLEVPGNRHRRNGNISPQNLVGPHAASNHLNGLKTQSALFEPLDETTALADTFTATLLGGIEPEPQS